MSDTSQGFLIDTRKNNYRYKRFSLFTEAHSMLLPESKTAAPHRSSEKVLIFIISF